jgi:hypothetical protein
MYDPTPIYPTPFHPMRPNDRRDFKGKVKSLDRTYHPLRYYFIDFGIARRYEPENLPVQEPILQGGDRTAPEHANLSGTCDPFPTDVYYLGNMIREDFARVRV